MFTEAQSSAGLALAPPLTLNHHRTMFNLLWSVSLHTHVQTIFSHLNLKDHKQKEITNCIEYISGNPSDRTVSSYLLLLIFVRLDQTDLYTDSEPFVQKLRGLRLRIERSLRAYLESTEPSHQHQDCWNLCKYKLDLLAHVHTL